MMAAGRHGLGVLSIGAGLPGAPEALAGQWQIAEEVHKGERRETLSYFGATLGLPPGRSNDPLCDGVKMGTKLVGDPDVDIKGIERLLNLSGGGFGGLMFRAHELETGNKRCEYLPDT